MYKSPFLLIEDFLSPLQAEEIIAELNWVNFNKTVDGSPIKASKHNDYCYDIVREKIEEKYETIDNYFNVKIDIIDSIIFEWFPVHYTLEKQPKTLKYFCGNSAFVRNKWTKVKKIDFTGILFLNDYNDSPPFDDDYEVYGGKLEFFQHGFGFNPKMGTLVLFPAGPNFINSTSSVIVGELNQVRIQLTCEQEFKFSLNDFKGDYTKWFRGR